jgi:uncharacterized protein (UPF0332 family)
MAVLNPRHLLEQAERLTVPTAPGPARQVDLRRAISSAYYAVFHFVLGEAADEFVGRTKRTAPRYALVYRSVDHRAFKTLCEHVRTSTPAPKIRAFLPPSTADTKLQEFAEAFLELQQKRHSADYDPSIQVKTSDALLAISVARSAIGKFSQSTPARRKAFLTLLLFPPR